MSDYLIEGCSDKGTYGGPLPLKIEVRHLDWRLIYRADNIKEARELAAKAFTSTCHSIIRIRKKS